MKTIEKWHSTSNSVSCYRLIACPFPNSIDVSEHITRLVKKRFGSKNGFAIWGSSSVTEIRYPFAFEAFSTSCSNWLIVSAWALIISFSPSISCRFLLNKSVVFRYSAHTLFPLVTASLRAVSASLNRLTQSAIRSGSPGNAIGATCWTALQKTFYLIAFVLRF